MATSRRRKRPAPQPTQLEIVYRDLAGLRPYARNARTHSKEQTAKIKRSLMRFGWTNPMLIADGEMIAGHGRLAGALELLAEGKTPKLTPSADVGPTIDLSHLSLADRRAYALADNRLALDAGWDEDLLAGEIAWLRDEDFDLGLTGFEAGETDSLLAGLGLPSGAKRRGGDGTPGALAERFGVPPFTVLNARDGWWQERKRAWLSLGIKSELGRGVGAHEAIAGGGIGKNSALLFRTDDGFKATRKRKAA